MTSPSRSSGGSRTYRHNHLRFRPRINSIVSARPHAFSVSATIPPSHSAPADALPRPWNSTAQNSMCSPKMDKANTSLGANPAGKLFACQEHVIVAIYDILLDIYTDIFFLTVIMAPCCLDTPHGMFRIFMWDTGNKLIEQKLVLRTICHIQNRPIRFFFHPVKPLGNSLMLPIGSFSLSSQLNSPHGY